MKTTADFVIGDKVRYVPHHAGGDIAHPDCENGIVSSANDVNIFVRYYDKRGGGLKIHAQATSPDNLVRT